MAHDSAEKECSESTLTSEEPIANIFLRARSGEPFGTKEDVNVLIDKLCDYIYRKLNDENWCPCDRHSNHPARENQEDRNTNESVPESYMQSIRRKVLEILSNYIGTFKNQLLARYGSHPTDPLALQEEETVCGSVSRDPTSYTMANTESLKNDIDKSQTSGMQSVTNTNVCKNSLSDISFDDWVSVGRCLSRENYFDQSPRVSVSASPATLRWSSDAETEDRFGSIPKPDRKTQACTAGSLREVRSERDNTRRHSPSDKTVTTGDKSETFKKTINKKLIKNSQGSTEKSHQQITTPPILTETDDYHADHFRHHNVAIEAIDGSAEAGADKGGSHNGTSSLEDASRSVDYNMTRKRKSGKSAAQRRMRRKARNVVHFLMQLRKPV